MKFGYTVVYGPDVAAHMSRQPLGVEVACVTDDVHWSVAVVPVHDRAVSAGRAGPLDLPRHPHFTGRHGP